MTVCPILLRGKKKLKLHLWSQWQWQETSLNDSENLLFHLEVLAWVCCTVVCFRLTHSRTKKVERCSISSHSLYSIQKTTTKKEGLGPKILLLTGSRKKKELKRSVLRHWSETWLVRGLMLHKMIFYLHQTGKLRTSSFEHLWTWNSLVWAWCSQWLRIWTLYHAV